MNDIDRVAFAMEVLTAVSHQLAGAAVGTGQGSMACPQCQALGREGTVRWNYEKRRGRSRHRQSFVAWCSTADCIRFSGH